LTGARLVQSRSSAPIDFAELTFQAFAFAGLGTESGMTAPVTSELQGRGLSGCIEGRKALEETGGKLPTSRCSANLA